VLLPGEALAQEQRELSTDRPDKTESPYTVEQGRVQIELDAAKHTIDQDGERRIETLNLVPFNLKYGVGENTDVQLIFGSLIRETERDRATGRERVTKGVGDVTLRIKHNLWGNDGARTAFALMPFVTLPTASNGLGADAVEAGIIAPLSVGLSNNIDVGVMTEVDLRRESDGSGYAPVFINSATTSFDVTDHVSVYTELFTQRSTDTGSRWLVTFDSGVTYAIGADLQLDAGVNLGLTDEADDAEFFLGLSRRF
jgi:hypothetical protein